MRSVQSAQRERKPKCRQKNQSTQIRNPSNLLHFPFGAAERRGTVAEMDFHFSSVSIHSVDPKTCKLWCQKQFSPLSTSSTFFFHSSLPPFRRVPGVPGPLKGPPKSVDSVEDAINRIKTPLGPLQISHSSIRGVANKYKVGDRCRSPTFPSLPPAPPPL